MKTITAYHRPTDLKEALELIGREDVENVLISGGTVAATRDYPAGTELIDLQRAVPAGIERREGRLSFGAMTRLQDIVDSEQVPSLLREVAHREGPSTFRHAATIGGTVAEADWESELLAGLLVHEAAVAIARAEGMSSVPLEDLLTDTGLLAGGIIASVTVATEGEAAVVRTGRTPADTAIVAAAGRVVSEGYRVALTGVASIPVLVDPTDLSPLDPPGDFRGSSEYRRQLAATLTKRVIARLGGAS